MDKVCIILINWNTNEHTEECVSSILKSDYKDYIILIIDNNSEIKPSIRDNDKIKVILQNSNLGFAGANNVGIKYALANGFKYCWILNNDTIINHDTLSRLLLVASEMKYAVFGNLILNYYDPEIIWYNGGYYSKIYGMGIMNDKGKKVGNVLLTSKKVEFITGCSMFVSTEIITKIGGFDESLIAYSEDVDLSLRFKLAGITMYYVHNAVVFHKEGESMKKNSKSTSKLLKTSPLQRYLYTRNILVVSRKYVSHFNFLLIYFRHLVKLLPKIIILLLVGEKDASVAYINALKDGFVARSSSKINLDR